MAYLFTHFIGEQLQGEQIYFSLHPVSDDKKHRLPRFAAYFCWCGSPTSRLFEALSAVVILAEPPLRDSPTIQRWRGKRGNGIFHHHRVASPPMAKGCIATPPTLYLYIYIPNP